MVEIIFWIYNSYFHKESIGFRGIVELERQTGSAFLVDIGEN